MPICRTVNCKRELTWLEDTKCWRCLVCNPLTPVGRTVEPEKKYIDVKLTEARVREICRDELENWHIQKPPVEVKEIDLALRSDWRQQAKELGIPLFQRKKEDVLQEIQSRLTEKTEASSIEDKTLRP